MIIPVQSRSAAEVLPAVKTLLSPNGKAVADVRTNSLIITDEYEAIQKIREFIEGYDKPVQQVRVRVRFMEALSSQGRSASAEGGVSGRHWHVATGRTRREGVHARVEDRRRRQGHRSEYFVNVTSGSPAYIVTGKNILFRERWVYLTQRYAAYGDRIVAQRVETGMDVTPVIVGDHARIEITPTISHLDPQGRIGITRFQLGRGGASGADRYQFAVAAFGIRPGFQALYPGKEIMPAFRETSLPQIITMGAF